MTLALRDRSGKGLIDVHAHYSVPVPAEMNDTFDRMAREQFFLHRPALSDWTAQEAIEFMGGYGIQFQLLSFPGELGLPIAQRVNDFGAEVISGNADRFGLLANVPAGDPIAAVAEIKRAAEELHADGFVLVTNYAGRYLGDPIFEPVLRELDERSATVFLHPVAPNCFADLACGRPGPVLEFPMDTARSVIDAVYARVFQRFPHIKFILAHGGGALATLADRIATTGLMSWVPNPHNVTAEDVYSQIASLYYDTALAGSPFSLLPLLQATTADHIVFGTDYPPAGDAGITHHVEQLSTTALLTNEQIADFHDTALTLFPTVLRRLASC